MKDNKCIKFNPDLLHQETFRGEDGLSKYRRRSIDKGGFTVKKIQWN